MANLLYIGGPRSTSADPEVTALKATGHSVEFTPVYTDAIAAPVYKKVPVFDAVIVANVDALYKDKGKPSVQDPVSFVQTLARSGKPIVVYGDLVPARRQELGELGRNVTVYDKLAVDAKSLPRKVQEVLDRAQEQGAAVGAGRG